MANNLPNVLNDGDDDGDPEMNNIHSLLARENTLNDQQAAVIINDIWLQEARYHAICYILSTTWLLSLLPFRVLTISMSIIYLNRFLARRRIETGMHWRVRLLAIACLSLSAQMDVNRIYLPELSEYPVGEYNISVNDIRNMQSIVLNELNWDMNVVTPFPFASFILSRFNRQILGATSMGIGAFILRILRDMRSMTQRPSVIAAAVILFAINKNLTRQQLETEIYAMPLNGFFNTDNVWHCYSILSQTNNPS